MSPSMLGLPHRVAAPALGSRGVLHDQVGQPHALRHLDATGPAHDERLQPGETALFPLGEALVERRGYGQPQHAVAQELQALVGAGALAHPRGMGERPLQEVGRQRATSSMRVSGFRRRPSGGQAPPPDCPR